MGRQEYQTSVSQAALERPSAGEARQLSPFGEVLVEVMAVFLYAAAASVAILVVGTLGWAAFKRGWIWSDGGAQWRLLQLTLIPWVLLLLRLVAQAWESLRLPQPPTKTYTRMVADRLKPQRSKDYHLVPVYFAEDTLNNIPISEVVEFCQLVGVRGHTKRNWVKQFRFRGTGRLCDYDTWHELCSMLVDVRVLQGWGPRKAGRLVVKDGNEILARLGLAHFGRTDTDGRSKPAETSLNPVRASQSD